MNFYERVQLESERTIYVIDKLREKGITASAINYTLGVNIDIGTCDDESAIELVNQLFKEAKLNIR